MTRYIVILSKEVHETYDVYASSAAEAKELATSGEIDPEEGETTVKETEILSCKEVKSSVDD
jgi:hypothetical protein